MNNKKILGILVIVLVISSVFFIISINEKINGNSVNDETIRVGAILPLSGNLASYGYSSKAGLDLAIKEINDAGGINGKALEVIYEDSEGSSTKGVSSIQKLISENDIKVIIGPVMSSVSLAISPIAENNKVIVITISSSPDISDAGDYIFRNREKATQQSEVLSEFVVKKIGARKIATLYRDDATGKGHVLTFEEYLNNLGVDILASEAYLPGNLDFRTQLLKIKSKNPEVIYIASSPKEVGFILKQARELGIDSQFIGTSGNEGKEVVEIAGKYAEGLIYTIPSGDPRKKEVSEFSEKYNDKYPNGQVELGALLYDSLNIVVKAMNFCNNPKDTDCIKDELYKTQGYGGASGTTSFDSNGDATKEIILKTVKDGEFVVLN